MNRRLAVLSCLAALMVEGLPRARAVAPATDLPPAASAPLTTDDADQLLGQLVVNVQVDGPPWAAELLRSLPVRPGMFLTRDRLSRALLYFQQNAPDRVAEVRALGERATAGGRTGVRLLFRVKPVEKIARVAFVNEGPLDTATLRNAVNLPTGAEFWPVAVQNAATRVALRYARLGWRETAVTWEATPDPEGLLITFTIHRGAATTLVRIEFTGDRGLPDADLASVFGIAPGQRLSMDSIEAGIVELRQRYRNGHYYRAQLGLPIVKTADLRAVVEIPLDAGPRFHLQVRGNRHFGDAFLLNQLHYQGDEILDRATERDLAERLRAFYEVAGFPLARVDAHENKLASSKGSPKELVTFLITEGPPVRVVDIRFTGNPLRAFPVSDLRRRVEASLEDTVPPDLVSGMDKALLREARLAGSPGEVLHPTPRVLPHEVFSTDAYKKACDEIAGLYRSKGYLDVQVGPPDLAQLDGSPCSGAPPRGHTLHCRALIPIDPGQQTIVASVGFSGVHELAPDKVQRAITVHAGQPLSFFDIEQTRDAIIQLYQRAGYLSVLVDDQERYKPADPTQESVVFVITEGVAVHASAIDIRGATHTPAWLIRHAITIHEGDIITPESEQESVRDLIKLGVFSSATVVPAARDQPRTPLLVTLQEQPGLTLDVSAGISLVDGPRARIDFAAAHFLGSVDTFTASAKVDLPIFRYCLYGITGCPPGIESPSNPVEYQLSTGLAFPVFGAPGEAPLNQQVQLIAQNLLRPNYFLEKVSALGTVTGLPHARWGKVELNTIFQLEVEDDLFQPVISNIQYGETFTDQRTLQLTPTGQTTLASFRPAVALDARDNRFNPMSGGTARLALDFSHSFGGGGLFSTNLGTVSVALISALLSASGYVPINRPHRIVLYLAGRAGRIFSATAPPVIGTKAFFLGGTESLRGFNEDEVIPEDVRRTLHSQISACRQLASQVGCNPGTLTLMQDPSAWPSPGGEVVLAGRSELRFGMTETLDGALFVDAGNLWANPALVNPTDLRYSTGVGIRMALPIGPAAVDFGFNLAPDIALGESLFRVHFSIGGG